MNSLIGKLSWWVTARPYITILVLLLLTGVMAYGTTYRASPTEGASLEFLPPHHPIGAAAEEIDEFFGDSSQVRVATVIFRGDAITPGGLSQMDSLITEIVTDPAVGPVLDPHNPVVAPSFFIKAALQVDDLGSLSQAQIDAARDVPGIGEAIAAMTGEDTDGALIAIANIRLGDTGDEQVANAERKISELAAGDEGPLTARSISPAIVEDEYTEATESGLGPFIGLALLLIAGLLLLFTRTISDTLLTLAGLIIAITWIVGAEGWIGPNALNIIGPPSSLTSMVPVIIISLTVDYAIQAISHYREQRIAGLPVLGAARMGLRNVTVPLMLAAITTIVSLLATLFSPIGVIGDFGVVAGLGVGLSLIVMLTLIPAGRVIIDGRRESRGTLKPPRPISDALPGISRMAEVIGRRVTRQPAPYIVGVIVVTAVLGFAATDLKSEFSVRDVLPNNGAVVEDMNTLDAAVGGSTEMASLLIRAEVTDGRTLLNLHDLTSAFEDEENRPRAVAGPIQRSYEELVHDWTDDSGEPGDKYDAELDALFDQASPGVELDPTLMQQFVDRLIPREPELQRFLINDPDGIDAMLLQFPTYLGDPEGTRMIQEGIEGVWYGEDSDITAISSAIISVAVTDQITDRQSEAISSTIALALGILAIFFWVTLRQPALGFIAVAPIVLVLISVLGTMALLDIPYSLITSIITALSIGIGVDYTIHIIHRYREEYSHWRNPEQAAIRTLATTGSALLGSAMTTALGFGVLIASPLTASTQFGITATITIVYSLIVSVLVVLPAMVVWGAFQNMRLRSAVQRWTDELDVEIDAVHRRYEQGY